MIPAQRDLLALAKMVIKFSKMPPTGQGKWKTDTQYLAEVVAPMAEALIRECGEPKDIKVLEQ